MTQYFCCSQEKSLDITLKIVAFHHCLQTQAISTVLIEFLESLVNLLFFILIRFFFYFLKLVWFIRGYLMFLRETFSLYFLFCQLDCNFFKTFDRRHRYVFTRISCLSFLIIWWRDKTHNFFPCDSSLTPPRTYMVFWFLPDEQMDNLPWHIFHVHSSGRLFFFIFFASIE